MTVKTWVGALALLTAIAAFAGVWVFLNPPTPPLRAAYAAPMQPLDARSGVYRQEDGEQRLVLPGLDGGFRLFALGPSGSAGFAPDPGGFGTAGARLTFTAGRYERERNGETIHAERLENQPYTVRAVETDTAGAPLHGWLFTPARPQGVGAVILHGSGDSDRDNGWYVYLVHKLAMAGVTVILPDKRGSGRSGGDWRDADLDVLAADGAAWITVLRREAPGLDRYGPIGVSQGGMFAPDTAALAHADFAVALSTTSTSLREQLDAEIRNDALASGAPDWALPVVVSAFSARARGRYPDFWRHNGDVRMLDGWDDWRGPFFIALGRDDEHDNVPIARSLEILEGAYRDAPGPSWHVYDGAGHALTGADGLFLPAFLDDLFAFLEVEGGTGPQAGD